MRWDIVVNKLNEKVSNLDAVFKKTFQRQNVEKWIEETISKRIQRTGIDSEGNKLKTDSSSSGEVYSNLTIILKEKVSGIGGIDSHVTLYDTGQFWESLRVVLKQSGFDIEADFEKDDGHMYKNFTRDYADQEEFEEKIAGLSHSELQYMFENKINPEFLRQLNAL